MACVLLLVMTTLQGCATSRSQETAVSAPTIATFALPDLDPRDAQRCYDPGVRADAQALVELGRTRVALADCRRKHGRVVKAYTTLQELNAQSNQGEKQ